MAFLKPASYVAMEPKQEPGCSEPRPGAGQGPLPGPLCAPAVRRHTAHSCGGEPRCLRAGYTDLPDWQFMVELEGFLSREDILRYQRNCSV